jgi:tRNA-2-methylthio-N6-dimethylallyladenosine synthase
MKPKRLYIYTIGCQMNVYDSERMAAHLSSLGYSACGRLESADLIILNTCTIRAKAEQKAVSFLGRLARLKQQKPEMIIAIGGCVAQQEGSGLLQRFPHLDLVFGTRAIARLPSLVDRIEAKRCRLIDIDLSDRPDPRGDLPGRITGSAVSRYVTIMRGCDNYCAYCVVPYVRGRETSRNPEHIVTEIEALARGGVKEVTLLGQNVNSYGRKENTASFVELLRRVNAIEGIVRIRFTTSHPKDFDLELIHAMQTLDKLCRHLHLPVQSGADTILERMNRKYTRDLYLDKVGKLRDTCPEVALTSDIIVGFPGETEADFKQTLDLIRTVQYDGLFAFMYSDRPNAPAAGYGSKIAETLKSERLQEVLSLQEGITRRKNEALVGSIQTILVEGVNRQRPGDGSGAPERRQWTGRTSSNKIVNFFICNSSPDDDLKILGQLVDVRIIRAFSHSLWGEPVESAKSREELKGDTHHAA